MPAPRRRRLLLVLAAAPALAVRGTLANAQSPGPAVAAASDLQYTLPEIADAFRRSTGSAVRIAFGASGNFTQQIENGAPFELFLSADEAYVERLAQRGLTRDAGVLYAVGRVALFVPAGSPLPANATIDDLKRAVAEGRVRRFAIANPEHAPYGRAAREVLQANGLWDALQPAMVLGENVGQAAQFAAGGQAQGGIIPWSMAKSAPIAARGTATLLGDRDHRPLRQRMALMRNAGAVAESFYRYLQSPDARAIFVRHGFALPGEASGG